MSIGILKKIQKNLKNILHPKNKQTLASLLKDYKPLEIPRFTSYNKD